VRDISITADDRDAPQRKLVCLFVGLHEDVSAANAGLKVARLEGREEGLEKGRGEGRQEGRQESREEGRQEGREEGRFAEKIEMIQLLERSLQRPETPSEQLVQRSLGELSQLVDQLLAQMKGK
jgi:flagellar biosynthesis/type III secretory pathway protein FliH